MLCARSVCLRRMAGGAWDQVMRFWRFLDNERVTVEKLIEGWSAQTREAVRGRHVLAIQDSSDIKFSTTPEDRRGLGKVGKGNVFGVILHAMMAVDADTGACLGLAGGKVWTRNSHGKARRGRRALADKESARWLTTATQAKDVLAQARMITVINDREGDIYAHWARTPDARVHLLSRVMHDHTLITGKTLRKAVKQVPFSAKAVIDVPKRLDRRPRKAHLSLRFGSVVLQRPKYTQEKDLPESVAVNFVEVIEQHPPKGAEPIHWLLLTTHEMANVARAATIVIQLVQARNGEDVLPAGFAFSPQEIEVLDAINKDLQGKTELQKNPHRKKTLAWAAWVIAKLGGWTGYASHKPPGPITFHNGLARFQAFASGWALKNV